MPEDYRFEMYGGEDEIGVLAGRFCVDDSYAIDRPAGRNDWLVMYTVGGQGYLRTPDGERRCAPGDVALLKAGTPHRYGTSPGERWHFFWAHFPPDRVYPGLLPEAPTTVRTIAAGRTRRRVLGAFRRMLLDARERGPYWSELCIGAVEEALALSSRTAERRLDPRVEETLRRLSANLREPARLETLSAAAGLSPSRLSHLFKEVTGQSVVEALNAMRVRQAALLLELTRLSAAEIAYEVGFQNYNHFLAQFRRRFGTNPSGFRRDRTGGGK